MQSALRNSRKHQVRILNQFLASCDGVRQVTSDGYCEEIETTQLKEREMRTDTEIRRDVESELQWDPSIDDSTIGVVVHNGVVTLTGEVAHFGGKRTAEDITKRVKGVKAIANEIQTKILAGGLRSDTAIAEAAANALRWNVATGTAQIQAVVKDAFVTLSGQAMWGFQKTSAENAVRNLMGVKGIANSIEVTTTIKPGEVKQKIQDAFKRQAIFDSKDIDIKVDDSTVTLKGHVRTWQEREDAALAAWAAPGVGNVENELYLQF
jgi:osmotically-inducible protein OsmY